MQNLFSSPDFQPSLDVFGSQQQQPSMNIDINSLLQSPQPMDEIPRPNIEQPNIEQPEIADTGDEDTDSINNLITQSYKPRTAFSEALTKSLGDMPTREQFGEPGKWRKFGGILAGLSGQPGSRDAFTNAKFYEAKGDWKDKIDTLMKGATEEDKYNINQRLLAQATGKYETDVGKLENQKIRTEAYAYDKKNPNLQKIVPKTGNVQLYNPKTGETKDTGIDVGGLSEEEKQKLRTGGKLEEIKARLEGNIKLEGAKQTNRITNIGLGGEQARETKAAPSGMAGTPTQEKIQQYNNARQTLLEHPEWKKFITLDVNGPNTFTIHEPSSGAFYSSGPSKSDYDKIVQSIVGKPSSAADKTIDTAQGKTTDNAPIAPEGWKYIPKAGGGWTAVKKNN